MGCSYLWKEDATQGACNALLEYHEDITDDVLKGAEAKAIVRGIEEGYRPAILRKDVEDAIKEN